ncbi:MFS transporter [Kribbella sp. NPDC026611]|uniref:MFS transporter n=1 Tax=Kribbella sp. NPDC026611 TaxID=3154911 RepID=UPI00340DA883
MSELSVRTQVLALASVVFVDLLGLAIILPSLPFFVLHLGGSGLALGAILTSYSLAQMAAAPVLGRLSDRYGRRGLLLLSLAGSTASFALSALAPTVTLLIVARVLAGLCGGSITVAYAFAADITTSEDRRSAMGRIGAGIGLAFTVGPAIGAALAPLGFASVCWAGAAVTAANLVAAWRVLPHPSGPEHPTPRPPSPRAERPRLLIVLVLGGAVVTGAFVSMETTVGLLVDARYRYGPSGVGWLLALAGLSMVLAQIGIGLRRARQVPDRIVALGSMTLVAAGLAAIPVAWAPGTVLGVLLLSAAYGAFTVTQASLISRSGPPTSTGVRLGWSQSANAAGRACGPLGAGLLYDLHADLPYLVAAVATAVMATLLAGAERSN